MTVNERTVCLKLNNKKEVELVSEAVKEAGLSVTEAKIIDEIRSSVKDIDLIIVDSIIGEKYKEELLNIRGLSNVYLPLLVLIPNTHPGGPWLEAGYDDTIRMPVSKSELKARIQAYIRLRAQEEAILKGSEEKYKAVFENTGTATAIVDPDGTISLVNAEFEKLSGFTRRETEGKKKWFEFVCENDLKRMSDFFNKRLSDKNLVPKSYEFVGICKSGEVKNVYITVSIIPGSQKRLASMIDITDRKRVEEELRFSKETYSGIIDAVTEAIYIQDEDGRFLFVNESAVKMYGYSREYFIGKTPEFLSAPDKNDLADIAIKIKRAFNGEPQRFEFWGMKKDGTLFPKEVSLTLGTYFGEKAVIAVARDITEQKRTEALIQRDLQEKEILLKELHHRVKNNLTVITSLLNLQAQKIETKEEALNGFKESRDRVFSMALVHEKLYKSNDLTNIDMKSYIVDMVNQLKNLYDFGNNVKIEIDVKNVLLDVNTAIPCGLILNEMITNALKHAFPEHQSGKIKIKLFPRKKLDYEFYVSDNGVGLPEDFDIKEVDSLGLRLISMLTEQINGRLEVSRNKGTSFKIVFHVVS